MTILHSDVSNTNAGKNSNILGSNSSAGSAGSGQSDLDMLVTAYTAPMPNSKVILTDFEAKRRAKPG